MQGTVFLENLIVETNIGVTAGERAQPQRLSISVFVELENTRAVSSDNVADTLNYAYIKKRVEAISTHQQFCLLETMAGVILNAALEFPEAVSVKVVVQKLDIWQNAVPGFMLEQKRPLII